MIFPFKFIDSIEFIEYTDEDMAATDNAVLEVEIVKRLDIDQFDPALVIQELLHREAQHC